MGQSKEDTKLTNTQIRASILTSLTIWYCCW